ncbi:hypothetical protein DL96DRAFT_1464492 [Flagelloscypha sp. PMI_526]|nr:hypothetical protein DL96DRAFT_1464492 [Flagelloscypha sp. PMI_526]
MKSFSFLSFLALSGLASAGVTVYHQAQATLVPSTGAHNSTKLTPPPLPNPMPATNYNIQLQTGMPGASIAIPSAFLGFSIEMSVANQVLGHNSSLIQVPFLNLIQNIVQRSGGIFIRVGGNTQDFATLVPDLGNGKILEKDKSKMTGNNPTQTPPLLLGHDLLVLMRTISSFTNVHWYLGIPWIDQQYRLDIVKKGEEILGPFLEGLQASNEPDFYVAHSHRPEGYGPADYIKELQQLVTLMDADSAYSVAKTQLVVPSIANSNGWTFQQLYELGLLDTYAANIKYVAAERYPSDNCAAVWSTDGTVRQPQEMFPVYLTHESPKNLAGQYAADTAFAHSKSKPFYMFETNTASCGGFPGVSDSFGAALWGLDYALHLAYTNFSGAMFHVGGQSVYYNPFTAPPTNETAFHKWTVGPMYYDALIMAEILGKSNTSQVLDLNANNGAPTTPAYAIFENGGQPSKLALFNYMDDASGAAALTVNFGISGNEQPSSMKAKTFRSGSVSDKANFTWAGQTFGEAYSSDGRPTGEETIQDINCNGNTCSVQVPSPGFVLVFLNPDTAKQPPAQTYTTTALTKTQNTATVDPGVLATSNGHQDVSSKKYSTSIGSAQNNGTKTGLSLLIVALNITLGVLVALRRP